jgi:uncharacterized protein YbjQ (UPF0145 family)
MKSRDIAKKYGIDGAAFDTWLKDSHVPHKVGLMGGVDVPDGQNIDGIVNEFKQHQSREQDRAAVENAQREQAAQEKRAALASMLITSGFNFDGYTITKYSGYISGDDAVNIDRGTVGFFGGGTTDVGASLMGSLVNIRRNALTELKEAAYDLGCNAVIGVDFDYLTLDPETATSSGGTTYLPYVFGVTANGNAVIIERNNTVPT